MRVKWLGINNLMQYEASPEKAGVGGSIPSLATKLFGEVSRKNVLDLGCGNHLTR